jgi:hypothetical protein
MGNPAADDLVAVGHYRDSFRQHAIGELALRGFSFVRKDLADSNRQRKTFVEEEVLMLIMAI